MIELYFPKHPGTTQLRMPQSTPHVPDDLGIRWQGPVLNGDQSVEQRRRESELEATRRSLLHPTDHVENCDPVLRFHYRLNP